MKQTQLQIIKDKLAKHGEISRNECLQNYISRLSAIIQRLESEGYEFTTEHRKGDYVYILKARPLKKVYEVLEDKVIVKLI